MIYQEFVTDSITLNFFIINWYISFNQHYWSELLILKNNYKNNRNNVALEIIILSYLDGPEQIYVY